MMVCHDHLKDKKLQPEKVKDFNVAGAICDCIDVLVSQEKMASQEATLKTEYEDIFEPIPHANELPRDVVAEIQIKNAEKTIKSRSYPSPQKCKEAWRILIQQHLNAGRIRPLSSPCASPAFIVPKVNPNVLPRWVNDYQQLNENTITDSHPLPRIDDILNNCAKGKIWGTIDMTNSEVFTFPGLFRMESMWNPWNPSGIPYGIHGMNVGWDPSQFLIPWTSWIPHGMRMEWSWNDPFHMDSTWIPLDSIWNASISTLDSMEKSIWSPWNKFNSMIIPLESRRNHLIWLPKIVASWRIEHWTPWEITWCIHWTLFPLCYVGIVRHENKFNNSCNSLATHKSSVGKSRCSICRHNKQTHSFIPTTTIAHANHRRPRQSLPPHHHCRQRPSPSPAINDRSPPPRHTRTKTAATWQCHVTG